MKEIASFIERLALESGSLIQRYFDSGDFGLEYKGDASPVTRADREAEEILRSLIESSYPDHGIIGEEYGSVREDADYVWILDPIDGTQSFIHGIPLFGTLIGLLHKGRPIYGCIHQPILKQLCIGNNEHAMLNGQAIHVRDTQKLSEAILLSTDVFPPRYKRSRWKVCWDGLREDVRLMRTWGDCYGYLMVAMGRADIMIDPILSPWDLLPLIPIIRGAGGVITDIYGNEAEQGTSAVVANPVLHPEVMKRLIVKD